MKKTFGIAGFVILSFMLPQSASAATFSEIVVFGDSLSDTGNAFALTEAALGYGIPPSPYYEGRFSNGQVWIEYLAADLGITETNYAVGGATTGNNNTLIPGNPLGLPGLQQQIQSFVTTPTFDNKALYILVAGANDYLGGNVTNPLEPLQNLSNAAATLASVGAKNIWLANLPDLGNVPGTRNQSYATTLTTLTQFHNFGLTQVSQNISQQFPNTKVSIFDVNSIVNQAIASPSQFNFTNTTESCIARFDICDVKNNDFFFWDSIHPTTRAHRLVADSALALIEAENVPEPSDTLGMLALGVGVASVLKLQQKRSALKKENRTMNTGAIAPQLLPQNR